MNSELIHADESKKVIQALIPENRRVVFLFRELIFRIQLRPYRTPLAHPSDTSERSVNFRFADNSQTIREPRFSVLHATRPGLTSS